MCRMVCYTHVNFCTYKTNHLPLVCLCSLSLTCWLMFKKKKVLFVLTVVYHVSYSCMLKWRVLDMVLTIKVKYIFCNNLTISYFFFSVSQTVMQAWHLSTIQFWCCLTYRTNGHSYWCKNHKTRYGKSGHA